MTIESPILAPAIVLVRWSLAMFGWLAITRLPAMAKAGISLFDIVGSRGANLEGVVPDRVNWKAHNYSHLMEQPTLFHATVLILGVIVKHKGLDRARNALLQVFSRTTKAFAWTTIAHDRVFCFRN